MNCRDFERAWALILERRDDALAASPGGLEQHAEACPACRAIQARDRALLRLVAALPPAPESSPGFVDRVLVAAQQPEPLVSGSILFARFLRYAPIAAAAALAAMAVVVGPRIGGKTQAPPAVPAIVTERLRPARPSELSMAFAAATSATLDLARETSAPAARVGREVWNAAELPIPVSASMPPVDVLPDPADWQGVGDRVQARVAPLGGSARHAFGFLLVGASTGSRPIAPLPDK